MEENWVGRTVGSYRIESKIARGGVAATYRARQIDRERWAAVKVLTGGQGDPAFLESFRREAKAIAALRHPNILTVYDYGEEEGLAYMVMEYVAGGTLRDLQTDEPWSAAEAASLILPVARALHYAHSQGLVHCDVKPANILIPRLDWPLLSDFGLSKLHGSGAGPLMGSLSGTPAYLAPEQITGKPVDPRTDIYSLGIVLFELVTGRAPFGGETAGDVMLQRLLEVPPLPSQVNPSLGGDVDSLIFKAMARLPADRFADMSTLSGALAELATMADLEGRLPRKWTGTLQGTDLLGPRSDLEGPYFLAVGTGASLPLPDRAEVLLGRADLRPTKQPDIDLEPHGGFEAGVSRYHARLHKSGDRWLIEDLDSTNGTFVNSTRVRPGELVPIGSEDVIHCGRVTLVFYNA